MDPLKPTQLFGYHDLIVPAVPDFLVGMLARAVEAAEAAEVETAPQAVSVPPKLYATTMPLKGGPVKVLEYEHDPEGHRQLANLIRGERVIAVVLGRRVNIESSSVVDMDIDGTAVTDRIPHLDS